MKGRHADRGGGKLPSLTHNMVSLGGMILAACSFFAVVCLFAIDFFRGFGNQYLGILTYIVAPGFLITGLLLVALGALLERRRRRKLQPGEIPAFPRIDLNVPEQRQAILAIAAVTFLMLLVTALGSYRTYQYTESVEFCGTACHSVMQPEYTAYQESPHAHVACVQCHIGPGASWYVKSKISGAYQVYATLVDKYPRPITAPVENLRPVRLTCEECHWPRKFFGAVEKVWHHYLPGRSNADWTIRMLLKIGGGDPAFGPVGGIHWHMAVANKVEYISTTNNLQVIPWVRLTDPQGKVTVYQSRDNPLQPAQIAAAKVHVMDCVDCHNRPTHIYHTPVYAVDLAMSTGRISTNVPDIKAQAVRALTAKYETTGGALRGISRMLTAYYQTNDPAFGRGHAELVAGAVREVQTIYTHNFFPEMKASWRVYPDNIGHLNSPGCFRCHDGNHVSADGKTITHDCQACHEIIAQGTGTAPSTLAAGGLPFKHPVDIGGMWQQSNCSVCHDGGLVP
jgi:NapC/NirT cytochrome c family, N-terminal region